MPTGIEIASICARSPIIVRIYSFYGNFVQIAVDSWTTAKVASELVATQLDIEDASRLVLADSVRHSFARASFALSERPLL